MLYCAVVDLQTGATTVNMTTAELIELAALDDPFILAALREHMARFSERVTLQGHEHGEDYAIVRNSGWDLFV